MKRKSAIVLLWAFAWDVPAFAADAALKMPAKAASSAVFDWTGFYIGGHAGYGGGGFGPGTNPLPEQGVFFPHSLTGLIGGYQAGYNIQLPNHVVLGAEADISFGSPLDAPRLTPAPFNITFDYIATARARVGYSMGAWMPYVTGGTAWGQTHVNLNDLGAVVPPKRELTHVGWTAGLGIEVAVGGNWTAKAEYDYIDLAGQTHDLSDLGLQRVNVDPNVHMFKVGLNYRRTGMPTRKQRCLRQPIPRSVHPMRARTACPAVGKGARHGRRRLFWAGGFGKAASFISTRSLRRVLV
jgi:high affinity Mn2+ porin